MASKGKGGNTGETAALTLKGVVEETTFRFSCGFRIPIEEVQPLTKAKLKKGDSVSFSINNVLVTPAHSHYYRCYCGAVLG